MQHDRTMLEVKTPMTPNPHNSIEFLIISANVASGTIEFHTEVGNGSLRLD